MRIALVTREYPPETAWGGIGSFYAGLARSLADAGHEVEVFAQGLERAYETDDQGVQIWRILGRADGLGPATPGDLAGNSDMGLFALGLARTMHEAVARRHREAPFDIIEGHEHLGINALINADVSLSAVKLTRYHSAYHTLVKRGLVDWPASPLIEALEGASIKQADHRISTSRVISQAVTEDFDAPQADVTLPNFVRRADYTGGWADKADQALFVGRLVLNHKRPDIAVQAFGRFAADHPSWRLKVVGPDQDYESGGTVWEHISEQIPAKLKSRIDYLGAKSLSEVYDLMAQSKAMLMPSDFESFGMVAVEAMQHGCLPLVSDSTATAEIAPDPRLVRRSGSVEDFAAGLSTLFENEATSDVAALSTQLRQHALENYSESKIVQDNLAFFESVIAQRSRPIAEVADPQLPLISVVVPSFNSATFIEETLLSIVNQDYPNIEVIVVDGSSSDGTVEIVERFADVRLISKPDKGQAHAINRGLLQARGDILAYLNADDVYRPGAFRAVAEQFRRRPDAMIIVGACEYIDESSKVMGELLIPKFSGLSGIIRYWGWGKWHTIPQQSTFWRRELTERIGLFDAKLHFVMDLDYWIRAAREFEIVTIPETLAAFRLVSGTKTISSTNKMYAEEHQAFRRYRHHLPWFQRLGSTWTAARHHSERMMGFAEGLYLEHGQRGQALEAALTSIRLFPLRIFTPRAWLMFGNMAASVMGLGTLSNRIHRRGLHLLAQLQGGS